MDKAFARAVLTRAISEIDRVGGVVPTLTPCDRAQRIRAQLCATSNQLAELRARLAPPRVARPARKAGAPRQA
jgi:hypothetical protein